MTSDIGYGRAGTREKSPARKASGSESRTWWDETEVGDHTLTRERTFFVCDACGEQQAYPFGV